MNKNISTVIKQKRHNYVINIIAFILLTNFALLHAQLTVYPTQNALNIRQNTDISIAFGTEIDPATINDTTFVVHAFQMGLRISHKRTFKVFVMQKLIETTTLTRLTFLDEIG